MWLRLRRKSKGQSTLEYIIVVTAILALIIVAATTFIRPASDASLNAASDTIDRAANVFLNN
ncbi:MAG: hypothetical protein ABH954_04710 [Candidatus Omnitrophota bacterium]